MNDIRPPARALNLLKLFCPAYLYEEIEGDLLEHFSRDVRKHGSTLAKRKFVWKVIKFFRPGIILRNKFSIQLNRGDMLGNYFKTMRRNVARHKTYSAINTFGLTTGITFALLIGIFIQGELKINQSLKDVDRLYLLESKYKGAEENNIWFAPAPLIPETSQQYPALIESYYRFWDRQVTVSKNDKHFRLQSMIGDSTFLEIFGFPIIYGDKKTALKDPNTIVITEKIARQYFDRTDVVGESLTLNTEINGKEEFLITAVIADLEEKNSVSDFMNMDAQIFLPMQNRSDFSLSDPALWPSDIITYVKLTKEGSAIDAKAAINKILKANTDDLPNKNRVIALDAIKDYYLVTNNGAVQKLLVSLAAIVLFILLLALCNFINITIASSFSRLKEIGVRKVIGGLKKQIILQFLTESVVMAFSSGILALLLYELLHNLFADLLGTSLPSLIQLSLSFWMWIVGGIFLIGIMAGGYPSFYLSGTKTIESLKGKFKSVKGTIRFSRGLIAIQFLIAIFIFIAAVIMTKQISFFLDKDLGYEKSFVLIVTSVPRLWSAEGFDKMETVKDEFMISPKIKSLSLSWGSPGNNNLSPMGGRIYKGGQKVGEGVLTAITCTDEDFTNVYGLNLQEGKYFFDENEPRSPFALVINESAKKALHVNVGDKVKMQYWGDIEFTITGIVNDFNYESLREAIKPLALMHNRDFFAYRYFSFKLNAGSLTESVQEVEKLWNKVFPDEPFVYSFASENLQTLYKTELQLKRASSIATILMLIIVLTGVLGLVSLSLTKRNKEIGIRKVLGASASSILVLISREYALLMAASFAIGIPLAYIFISRWLTGFAYHIELSWWMFAMPIAILFCITIVIIVFQCLRAILSNPVKALRYE